MQSNRPLPTQSRLSGKCGSDAAEIAEHLSLFAAVAVAQKLIAMSDERIEPWIPAIVAAVRSRYVSNKATAPQRQRRLS